MEDADKKTLKKHRVQLAKELLSEEILQFLVADDILTDFMVDHINSKTTKFNINVELLCTLPMRGPRAFNAFLKALNESGQKHLAYLLQEQNEMMDAQQSNLNPPHTLSTHFKDWGIESFDFNQSTDKPTSKKFSRNDPSVGSIPTNSTLLEAPKRSLNRKPTEHDDCPVYLQSSHNMSINDCCTTPKRPCCELTLSSSPKMDVVPSPCNDLEDLHCVLPMESVIVAANLVSPNHKFSESCTSFRNSTAQSKSLTFKAAKSFCNLPTAILNRSDVEKQSGRSLSLDNMDLTDGPTQGDITVRLARYSFQEHNVIDCYKMRSKPKGLALIISVDKFEPSACLEDRQAGEVDRSRLEFVLRQIGFRCFLLENGTAAEIWNVLEKFAALEDHYYCDCTFLAVMSHGEQGSFFGRDGNKIEIEHVEKLFANDRCKSLQNKPKLMFFQCCRGNQPDKGVDEMDGPTTPDKAIRDRIQAPQGDILSRSSSRSSINSLTIKNKLPSKSDCLVGYATVRGYAAMRNTRHGSWYIQALVRVLAYHSCDKHMLEIMTIVNNLVKQKEGWSPASEYHRCKEMSEFQSTLCKKMYLFPGK